ncbi:MAG: putative glycoside hydrolase [Chloroflexota bacterium]
MPQANPQSTPSNVVSPLSRVGFYLWGGPGTIRMNEVKYFSARHSEHSLLTCYDYDYLARAQELFGITDVWVSYSWGFKDETEAVDRRFIIERLNNFKRLGLKVHAYIQGPNLVWEDFKHTDWWARDERGRMITYYRGRRVASIHNRGYVAYVLDKIRDTYNLGFDGIFMDNIQHGQLGFPMPRGVLPFVFCGDASAPANAEFRAETGEDIPDDFERDPALTRAYLDFRVRSNTRYITEVADVVHAGGMEFGTNFYDPKFDPTNIYGIDMQAMAKVQDYILFENHALPADDGSKHNGYIDDLIEREGITKPVFVVTYREGIGMAPQFSQNDLDNIFSEGARARFHICLKGGEFTTRQVWHSLYLDGLKPPRTDKALPRQVQKLDSDFTAALARLGPMRRLIKRYYNPLFRAAFEWQPARALVYVAYKTTVM